VGALASVSGSVLALYETRRRPFVLASVALSGSTTTAISDDGERHRLTAADLRLGAMVGKTFFDRLVPYAAVRVFGGPVRWHIDGESVTGQDRYHYTVGGGLSVRLPADINIFVEAMPLGEQSGSLGASLPL